MKPDKFNIITHTKYWKYTHGDRNLSHLSVKIKYFLKFIINRLFLKNFGLAIVRTISTFRSEQNSYSNNSEILSIRNNDIANYIINFGASNGIDFDKQILLSNIEQYENLYREVKINNLNGGMGYNNGLFIYILICHFKPNVVLESGVWKGFSTYLIDNAIDHKSKIYCFDINLANREFLSTKAVYFESELSFINNIDYKSVDFAFFDDHVSIYDRLKFCIKNKIELVVVDDDVSLTQVHTDGWPPIPTASMIFNYNSIPKKFDWINNNIKATADISHLEVNDICKYYNYIPFPNLSEYTGYRDTSFTSLLIKRS